MNSRPWRSYAATALTGAAVIATPSLLTADWLDLRTALLFSALVFAFLFAHAAADMQRRDLGRLVAYAGGSIALVVACVAIGERLSLDAVAWPLVRLMLAWAFVLTLVAPGYEGRGVRWRTPRRIGLLVVAAAGLWLVLARATGGIRPYIIDEVLYLLQAQHALHPPFMQPLDPHLAPFFTLQQAYVRGGYLNGQYPPGWPLMLAWFPGAIGHWVVLLGVDLALIVATYAFGRLVASRGAGLLAAALVAISGLELFYSMTFFSEVFTAALVVTAGAMLIGGLRAAHRRTRLARLGTAGFLAGWVVATRPLTGVALWAAMLLLGWELERPSRDRLVRAGAAMLAGAAVPIGVLLWYNQLTTGSPFRFGYDVAERGFHALGFGPRGFVRYGMNGLPSLDVYPFDVHAATIYTARGIRRMLAVFWPASLVLPLAFLAGQLGARLRWRLVLPFALLPAAYFFYFYADFRFFFELLPLAMVGTAWLMVRVADRRPAAATALGVVMFASSFAVVGPWMATRANRARPYAPILQEIGRARAQHGHVLVFVRDVSTDVTKSFFTAMYAENLAGSFHGPIVVARDLGASDTTLMARYPGYAPYLLSNGGLTSTDSVRAAPHGFELVPLGDSVAPGGR